MLIRFVYSECVRSLEVLFFDLGIFGFRRLVAELKSFLSHLQRTDTSRDQVRQRNFILGWVRIFSCRSRYAKSIRLAFVCFSDVNRGIFSQRSLFVYVKFNLTFGTFVVIIWVSISIQLFGQVAYNIRLDGLDNRNVIVW